MTNNPPDPVAAVVASGFPFQMAVLQVVEAHVDEHRWQSAGPELAWGGEATAPNYADFVLVKEGRPDYMLVVECKRQAARWVFLVEPNAEAVQRAHVYWTGWNAIGKASRGWGATPIRPSTYEAAFCVQAGRSGTGERLLERDASKLAAGVEFLTQVHGFSPHLEKRRDLTIGAAVIVTTAELLVCKVPFGSIDLRTGRPLDLQVGLESVDMIRFRKALAGSGGRAPDLLEHDRRAQRTVFVVRASAFVGFLRQWGRPRSLPLGQGPWLQG